MSFHLPCLFIHNMVHVVGDVCDTFLSNKELHVTTLALLAVSLNRMQICNIVEVRFFVRSKFLETDIFVNHRIEAC